jgi:hypothetical protein
MLAAGELGDRAGQHGLLVDRPTLAALFHRLALGELDSADGDGKSCQRRPAEAAMHLLGSELLGEFALGGFLGLTQLLDLRVRAS